MLGSFVDGPEGRVCGSEVIGDTDTGYVPLQEKNY